MAEHEHVHMIIGRRLTRDEFLDLRAGISADSACLNPGCARVVSYRATRQGRQRLFCSDPCRLAYGRRRRRLMQILALLEWNRAYLDLPVTSTEMDAAIRQVTWELARYGGVDEDALSLLLPREPRIPLSVVIRNLDPTGPQAHDDASVDAAEQT